MKAPVNSRYAHCDGLTDIALYDDGNKGKIITCGSDGDIRVWSNPDDKNPIVFPPSDSGLGLACHGDTLYVGTENNTVESFSLPTGKEDKVIAKFTAAVNHVDVSKSGNILVAGSGDMTIKIIKLKESSTPTKIETHTAPVLSVVIDPLEEFFVSSGCDGCVYVWTLSSGKQVKSWDGVFPSSNDISLSKTLCRPSWRQDGSLVAVPQQNTVILYCRSGWKEEKTLRISGSKNKMLSVAQFSSCGKHLVAGSTDGTIFVWDVATSKLIYENVDTTDHITGITFSKSGKDVLAVDKLGRMIFVNDFLATHDSQNQDDDIDMDDELSDTVDNFVEKDAVAADDEPDPFDDDMDDLLLEDGSRDANGNDDNEISISKIKAMTGFIASDNDKEDVFVGVHRARKIAGIKNVIEDDDDDEGKSVSSSRDHNRVPEPDADQDNPQQINYRPLPVEMPFTKPQEPFQPSSSPETLRHRFMVWNSLGLIRNYDIEDDEADSIDIEFHDVSFHNAIHLRNQHEFTLAALGKEAVIFASSNSKSSGGQSKIMCLHFSTWDNSKEWSTDLPSDEEATTIAIGTGWFAVGTSMNRLRIFTIAGVQRNILDIGGQIIAISGYEDLLFVTFHSGIGLYGNQHISYSIIRIRSGTGIFPLLSSEPLPLSPKSEITWIGFSDEGTPSVADSAETVRILNGRMWTTFLSMKNSFRIDSEHYWVTSLSVCNQQVRAIKCKGTRYPPTLPRPTVLLLDAKLPLCEMETEKSQLEDTLLRAMMQNALAKKLDKKGVDAEDYKEKADKDIKENLMKLFAICCKGDKDFRASEYVAMLPSTHSIQIAIKYANKLRKMALTDHLTAIGRKKLDEEEDGVEEDEDDFENMRSGNVIYSSVYSTLGNPSTSVSNGPAICSSTGGSSFANDSCDVIFYEENPLLTRQRAEISSVCSASPANYKNPFKKDGGGGESKTASAEGNKTEFDSSKGLSLIDAWKKPADKPTLELNTKPSKAKNSKKGSEKDKSEKLSKADKNSNSNTTGGKKQTTLFAMTGRKSVGKEKQPKSPLPAEDENSNVSITCDSEEADSENVEPENVPVITEKKRKRSGQDDDIANDETDKKSRISSKLSAFALKRTSVEVDTEDNELADI